MQLRVNPDTVVRIEPVNHRELPAAVRIHAVLMLAYAQEAAVLQVPQFAPLDQTIDDLRASPDYFLVAVDGNDIVGALSLAPDDEPNQLTIASLVVHPSHQRRGIATLLLADALRRASGMVVSVSTGLKNLPALALYAKFGFVAYRQGTIGPHALQLVKLRCSAP